MNEAKAMAAKWAGTKGDTLDNADKRNKAWAVVPNGRTFHPHTKAVERIYVKR